MISCFFMGGLGNQLFQLSAAYSLAKEVDDDFGIDITQDDGIQMPAAFYKDSFFKNINKINLNSENFETIYNEPSFSYNKIPHKKNVILRGYFQSEKYFEKYYDEICALFINYEIISKLKNNFKLENSLSIHVRRGDYLTKPSYHTNQNLNYYLESIKYIERLKNIDNIYIFSDDIKWCKENFNDSRIVYTENLTDYEELYLMSLCNNNIIANSSFSWWGSYLNLNENKIVIVPKTWFGTLFQGSWQDIYFKNNIIL